MLKNIAEAVQPLDKAVEDSANFDKAGEANVIKAKVEEAIKESADLVTALEAVGAMYGIPPANIISNDASPSIRVVDDTIVAPPIPNPENHTKAIVQAVGSVLDYISQRIDDKVNDFQLKNIQNGITLDKMETLSDGPKGKCIGIYNDDEGGEIHAYDTGLVDMPNTPAAQAKVDALRASNTIPTFDPNAASKKPGDDYFNDEDDITNGVKMNVTSEMTEGEETIKEFSIAKEIQESAYHINMIGKLHDTTHLGYDLLNRHGFNFVKPVDSVVQESKTTEDVSKKGKKGKITKENIKYMKFDNSNIIKAIKFFNEARAEQDKDAEKIDTKKFLNNPAFKKGVECLNKQFDCNINLRFFADKSTYESVSTTLYNDIKRNLTISKSKGFQLNGQPISITIWNRFFESHTNDSTLFGQFMVGAMLHEIFHNISLVMRDAEAKMSLSLVATLNAAGSTDDIKKKRIIITNYVDTIDAASGNKLLDKLAKKKMVKQLIALSMIEKSESGVKKLEKCNERSENADKYIDNLIKGYKDAVKSSKKSYKGQYITWSLITAAGIIGSIILGNPIPAIAAGAISLTGLSATLSSSIEYAHAVSKYGSARLYEEYYCDLFAGMYQLPITWFIGRSKEKYVPNDFKPEKLDELAKLETELNKNIFSSYPTQLERNHASVRIAKTLLAQKDLDPEIKRYCKWIVDNFSNVHKTSINTIYNKSTFTPEEAEDLDKHLSNLISKNNITLTESFIQYYNSNEDVY